MNKIKAALMTGLLCLLAGCVSLPPPMPPELIYSKTEQSIQNPAVLIGVKEDTSFFLADELCYVENIDGRVVNDRHKNPTDPVFLDPGSHVLGIKFEQGHTYAHITLPFVAAPKGQYTIGHRTVSSFWDPPGHLQLWIQDASTGQEASSTAVTPISVQQSSPIFIPIMTK